MIKKHYWIIINPTRGDVCLTSLRLFRKDSIQSFILDHAETWSYFYKAGYRCRKVWLRGKPCPA